ncbi:hypothetical protein GE09DRAFT_389779 [Coniochaeta sp. 2T2.1]|nr:hypothetical protein GE09DRAFT_389779 [Coniochaeta sp. 2T2.1]
MSISHGLDANGLLRCLRLLSHIHHVSCLERRIEALPTPNAALKRRAIEKGHSFPGGAASCFDSSITKCWAAQICLGLCQESVRFFLISRTCEKNMCDPSGPPACPTDPHHARPPSRSGSLFVTTQDFSVINCNAGSLGSEFHPTSTPVPRSIETPGGCYPSSRIRRAARGAWAIGVEAIAARFTSQHARGAQQGEGGMHAQRRDSWQF